MRLDREATRAQLRALAAELAAIRRRAKAMRARVEQTEEFAEALAASKAGRNEECMASLAFAWCGVLDDVEQECRRLAEALEEDATRV